MGEFVVKLLPHQHSLPFSVPAYLNPPAEQVCWQRATVMLSLEVEKEERVRVAASWTQPSETQVPATGEETGAAGELLGAAGLEGVLEGETEGTGELEGTVGGRTTGLVVGITELEGTGELEGATDFTGLELGAAAELGVTVLGGAGEDEGDDEGA